MKEGRFTDIRTKVFSSTELFTPEEALKHIQSAAVWSEILSEKEPEAIKLMREHITETMVNYKAIRELEIVVISGKKN